MSNFAEGLPTSRIPFRQVSTGTGFLEIFPKRESSKIWNQSCIYSEYRTKCSGSTHRRCADFLRRMVGDTACRFKKGNRAEYRNRYLQLSGMESGRRSVDQAGAVHAVSGICRHASQRRTGNRSYVTQNQS